MKVLHVTAWYPTPEHPEWGVFVRRHIEVAMGLGECKVIHLSGEHRFRWWPRCEPVELGYRMRYWSRIPILNHLLSIVAVSVALRKLPERGRGFDIVHAHIAQSLPSAIFAAAWTRSAVVYSEHSSQFLSADPMQFSRVQRSLLRAILPRVSAWSAVSDGLRCALVAVTGIDRDRGYIVPNVVSEEFTSSGANPRKALSILWVGSLTEHKNPLLLIEAVSRMRHEAEVVMVGRGPLAVRLRETVDDLGLSKRVRLIARAPSAEVAELMRRSSVLALTSEFETFSVVAAEALASGVAVVTTPCGGPCEFVSPDDGVIVSDHSAEVLAAGLDLALETDWDRQAMSNRAISLFGADAVRSQLERLYDSVHVDSATGRTRK